MPATVGPGLQVKEILLSLLQALNAAVLTAETVQEDKVKEIRIFSFFNFLRQVFTMEPKMTWNSLCVPAGLELSGPPTLVSQVLGL